MKFLVFVITVSFAVFLDKAFLHNERLNEAVIKSVKSIKEKILKENRDTIKLPDLHVPLETSGKLSLEKGELKGFSNFELLGNTSLFLAFEHIIRVPIQFYDLKFTYNYSDDHLKSKESGQVTVNMADAYNRFVINVCQGGAPFFHYKENDERKVGAIDISYSGEKPGKVVTEALEDAFKTKIVGFAWKKLEIEIQAIMDDMNKWIAQNPKKAANIWSESLDDYMKKLKQVQATLRKNKEKSKG